MKSKDFSGIRNDRPLPDPQSVNLPDDCKDLLDDYIESATSMLEEIERTAMSYEQGNNVEENAAAIRRILHKIKGESSMMGIDEISDLCHQTEYAFEEVSSNQRPNIVLRFKDWVDTAMRSMANRV